MLDFADPDRSPRQAAAEGPVRPTARKARAPRVSPLVGLCFLAVVVMLGTGWLLAMRLVPPETHLTLLGRTFGPFALHEQITNLAMLALIVCSAFWIEAEMVGWRGSSLRQLLVSITPTLKTDLACFLLSHMRVYQAVARVMTFGASVISGVWLHDHVQALTGLSLAPLPAPLPVQVLFYFAVASFFDYWAHRIDHSRYMWPLHRYHHSATEFAVFTSIRVHPAAFTGIFLVNMPMALVGAPVDALIWVYLLTDALGFVIHSKIDADWGWIGRWIIQSPNNHRMHHKLDMSHPTGHYGRMPIWDHLFGTYYREGSGSVVIGVDKPYKQGFMAPRDMIRDYGDFWVGLFDGGEPRAAATSPAQATPPAVAAEVVPYPASPLRLDPQWSTAANSNTA